MTSAAPSLTWLRTAQSSAASVARWSAIALGFSVIVSTALNGVLMALLLVAWIASGGWRQKLARVRANPVAVGALGLLLLGVLGALWSQGTPEDTVLFANKHTKLLLVPILVGVLLDGKDRWRGLLAMAVGLLLTLGLSYALWLGVLPDMPFITGTGKNPTVFRKHISQNFFMAFGVLLFAVFAWRAPSARARWIWSVLAALAAVNVLWMVHGRTGYLVLAAIAALAAFQVWRWRGLALASLLVSLVFAATFALVPTFQGRIKEVVTHAQRWDPRVASRTSAEQRLEYYRNTLTVIRHHPWIGVGTGGFPAAYAEAVAGQGLLPARNPHNQYLLTAAELGVVGLAALLLFFLLHGQASRRLGDPGERMLARGLLVSMLIGCLFNSLLMDHAEGVFFAWLSGLLFAGLQDPSREPAPARTAR